MTPITIIGPHANLAQPGTLGSDPAPTPLISPPGPGTGSRARLTETVLQGMPDHLMGVDGATVQINPRGGGSLYIYQAATGSSTWANPLTTRDGRIEPVEQTGGEAWLETGSYDLLVSYGGQSYTSSFEAVVGADVVDLIANSAGITPLGDDGSTPIWSAGAGRYVAAKRTFIGLADPPINAPQDGVTDTAPYFDEAVQMVDAAGGGTVYVNDQAYKFAASYQAPVGLSHVEIAGTGENSIFDFTALATGFTGMLFDGVEQAAILLAANANSHDTTITLPAGQGVNFTVGDELRIGSAKLFDPDPTNVGLGVDQYIGELGWVRSVSGDVITLETPLLCDGGSYLTADGALVRRIDPGRSLTMRDVKFRGAGVGHGTNCVSFECYINVRVQDVFVEGFEHRGINFVTVNEARVKNCVLDGGSLSADGVAYGVAVSATSQDIVVETCTMSHWRHFVESSGSVDPAKPGLNRRVLALNNFGSDSRAMSFETHAGTTDYAFIGNQVTGGNGGIGMRAPRATIKNNVIRNNTGIGIWCRNQASCPSNYVISGNRISGTGDSGIVVSNDAQSIGGGAVTEGIVISGNVIDNAGQAAISVSTLDTTWRYSNVAITGNVIRNVALAMHGIYLNRADGCSITGNVVTGVTPSSSATGGIRIDDVSKSVVADNVISAQTVNGAGVRVISTCTHCLIHNNAVSGFTRGINIDDAATWIAIGLNDLSGQSIPVALGAGAGNTCVPVNKLGLAPDFEITSTNAGKNLAIFSSAPEQYFTAPITVDRDVNLPNSGNLLKGVEYYVVRAASATGAFKHNVRITGGGTILKALDPGQWCRVKLIDAVTPTWMLVGAGSL